MLKGGVIMDVVTAEQAKIAEEAGAVAVMALERVPADIRREGGVARMSDVSLIKGIMAAVTIPVMAKARIGHFVEAQVLQALGIDYVDESEVLTPADEEHHIDKWAFTVPFVCGARDLGEALRRIGEGAAMVRTKGEAGTGNVVEAVRHMRAVLGGIRQLQAMRHDELMAEAKRLGAPYELVAEVAETGRLPVVNFSAGGIATPADAALMMQLGADGNFVGQRHLQERRSARLRQGDRGRHHLLRQAGRDRRGERRAGQADARPGCRLDAQGGAARHSRLVRGGGGVGRPARSTAPPALGTLAGVTEMLPVPSPLGWLACPGDLKPSCA